MRLRVALKGPRLLCFSEIVPFTHRLRLLSFPQQQTPNPRVNAVTTMGEPIAFRLDRDADELFRKKAEAGGIGPNALAKQLALDALQEAGHFERVKARLVSLESTVEELRRDIAICASLLLIATKAMTEAEAKTWVKQNLLN